MCSKLVGQTLTCTFQSSILIWKATISKPLLCILTHFGTWTGGYSFKMVWIDTAPRSHIFLCDLVSSRSVWTVADGTEALPLNRCCKAFIDSFIVSISSHSSSIFSVGLAARGASLSPFSCCSFAAELFRRIFQYLTIFGPLGLPVINSKTLLVTWFDAVKVIVISGASCACAPKFHTLLNY